MIASNLEFTNKTAKVLATYLSNGQKPIITHLTLT